MFVSPFETEILLRLSPPIAPKTCHHHLQIIFHVHLRFAWQAWHNLTSTFVLRGRRGTNSHLPSFCVAGVALMVLGGALGPGFGACDARGAAPLCVAGVALGDIHLLPSFCVAGAALMVLGGALGPGFGAW